jgi:hypothetical protein
LSGREGVWGSLSLPPSLRARDSGVFGKMKCLFSIAPDARTRGEVVEQAYAEKHATDTHDARDRRAMQRLLPNPSGAARDYVEWHDRRAAFARQTLTSASVGLALRR